MADDRRQPLHGSPARRWRTRRQSGDEPHKRGLNTTLHRAVDAFGLPVRVIITHGPAADGTQASQLIDGIEAGHLIADKDYDTDAIIEQAAAQGMNAVIPPKKHRVHQSP